MENETRRSSKQVRAERPEGPALAGLVEEQFSRCGGCDEIDDEAAEQTEEADRLTPAKGEEISELFDRHCRVLETRALEQRRRCELTVLVKQEQLNATTTNECVSFDRYANDRFSGDARLRAVRALLSEIDKRGFERYAQATMTPSK